MLTCVTCTCCVTSLGWGDVNLHVTCVTCTCYVTSLGWGDVDVHGNLRHMHMLRHVTGLGGMLPFMSPASHAHATSRHWVGGMLMFMLTPVTCTCHVTSLAWASKNGGKLPVIKKKWPKGDPKLSHCVHSLWSAWA